MKNSLKILHVGNIAGIATTLANEQKKMGHKATVMSFNKHCLFHKSDYDNYILDKIPFNIFKNIFLILKLFPKHDVLHFHARSILPFFLDLPLWKFLGKTIVVHYHGSDIRYKNNSLCVKKCANCVFVSTPDLLEWAPDAIWVPNPIDVDKYSNLGEFNNQESESILIIHAPTVREVKGTQYIVDAIDKLKQEGYTVELKILECLSHDQIIMEFIKADIIVDQLLLGWYGVVSIEGMSLKKPVCVYIRDDLIQFIPKGSFVNCNPENIYVILKRVIEDSNLRKDIATNGYDFVCKFHNAEMVAKVIVAKYQS